MSGEKIGFWKRASWNVKYFFIKMKKYNILADDEVVRKIVEDGYSVARYGDGEFKLMLERKMNFFQRNDAELSKRLRDILLEDSGDTKVIIGIPRAIKDVSEYTPEAKRFWIKYWAREYKDLKDYLIKKEYCNANLTRPYMDYKDKSKDVMTAKFDNLKKIWNDKDILIIEGEKTMLGVGNDLFENCKSIQRIICPAKSAYDKYNEIFETAKQYGKDKLILVSLGPTATVLAYELAKSNYQAVDTGHIDIEYMWFKQGCVTKEAIKGKYVNEAKDNDYQTEIKDEKYESEIVSKIL